ncbi:putative transcription factor C2H2 family [Rosa chinensis]|uniref:Putative transcription factor C2H2 family n=1 Tax=Rosa chinensis TaxID=74649 RepID=A0A2P6QGM8_ROSCH|nr:uncharacterized protein LOC112202645 [Rosa chinensis]XP_024199411.1 uncharacterized protein LOC112202645 [Rosa chinensis]XP_024199414.1 uncharacterized protein LOC112202645 [Rosa chinensis]XP_040361888.1 uncharacterized protein LOC112202645 [Rosa chinensis]XP_040361889.1 uncharacterized protein LOC112202645 [Rosa chinensis]XP_040361890.1 uncharacterized protein LOC112202645 [Rosa chinensis]XP_040361891.1 uncharacterized protein LOC112202645 [Rosa chinensis]PRQ33332.1 putative transcriptio
MAIAGLQNVSVLDSSFLRSSQSGASRRVDNEGRAHSRASSLLQMWRELEDEHMVSRPLERVGERLFQQRSDGVGSENTGDLDDASVAESECRTWSQGQIGSSPEHDEYSNFSSEHSSDFGDGERGRVRQIFQEWMNCGASECASNVSRMNNSSRAELLGETEQERVRIIREWVRMNSQQRVASGDNGEEQPAEFGNQIARVRDGLVVNQSGGQSEHNRRGIRKLCGRQALLDMLKKAERERQIELQVLSEHQPVTRFAHRNRIQSLLRGRFLRNGRAIENERPISMAETELGLLRQRHTVSGLRDGFDSKLDSPVCGQVGSCHSESSSSNSNGIRSGHTQPNNSHEVVSGSFEQSEANDVASNDRGHNSCGTSAARADLGGNTIQDIDSHESNAPIEHGQEEIPDNVVSGWQCSSSIEIVESRDGACQNMIGNLLTTTAVEQSQETLHNDANDHSYIQGASDLSNEQSELDGDESVIHELSHADGNMLEDVNFQESNSQPHQVQADEYNSLIENVVEHTGEDQQETAGYEWSQELVENEDREDDQLQEVPEVWHDESGFQEAVQSWLEGPSSQDSDSVRRADTFYFPDDENAHNTELRELLSRRRVSNLLSSGFRQNLDQLIQSYVERQGHAAIDWDEASAYPELTEDMEQTYQSEVQVNAVESPHLALPPQPIPSSPLWHQESPHDNWPRHDMHQRFGIDWEMVNDMRIDMARLQQRMNNLQRMLEACMDMQLELQRSIRQEVSDALNRSAGSQGVCEDGLLDDGSKWDNVRKGICCICCVSSIDSLLYRCGHMCTCSKCATKLVESSGKCPMCRAPAVEVIRAYSVL